MLWKLFAVGLVFGLGGREVRRFEEAAAREIGSKLEGPQKRVEVRTQPHGPFAVAGDLRRATIRAEHFSTEGLPLFTEPEYSQKGRLRELKLDLRDFVLAGLRVERLEATIPECRYDFDLAVRKRMIRLSRSGTGTGRVLLLAKDLEAFILRKFREIKRVEVRLDRDRLWVKGFGEFVVIQTEFEVMARLTPVDGTRLKLTDAHVYFDGLIADAAVRDLVLQTLNPVVDLDQDLKLHGAVRVDSITLRNGQLEVSGQTRIPDRPKEGGARLQPSSKDWAARKADSGSIDGRVFSAVRTATNRLP